MFCKNCGTEISDTAQFCRKCGYNIKNVEMEKRKIIEDNIVRFQLTPTFSYSYQFLSSLWRAVVWIFIISMFVVNLPVLWLLYPFTFLITLLIVGAYIVIKMLIQKKQYDNLEYNFYATKVEYKDGFINKEEKELKYKFIREITMSQSIIERMCNLGTIRIHTSASSAYDSSSNSHTSHKGKNGIFIHCVKNVQEQYKAIKQITDEQISEE